MSLGDRVRHRFGTDAAAEGVAAEGRGRAIVKSLSTI
jgi:hypothetical protein